MKANQLYSVYIGFVFIVQFAIRIRNEESGNEKLIMCATE